jgi:hypothetical protein
MAPSTPRCRNAAPATGSRAQSSVHARNRRASPPSHRRGRVRRCARAMTLPCFNRCSLDERLAMLKGGAAVEPPPPAAARCILQPAAHPGPPSHPHTARAPIGCAEACKKPPVIAAPTCSQLSALSSDDVSYRPTSSDHGDQSARNPLRSRGSHRVEARMTLPAVIAARTHSQPQHAARCSRMLQRPHLPRPPAGWPVGHPGAVQQAGEGAAEGAGRRGPAALLLPLPLVRGRR